MQRRQLSTLERGGNVTLNTLRKVIGFLPNLEEFTFEQVRMKPTYIDLPPFEWQVFYANMYTLHETLDAPDDESRDGDAEAFRAAELDEECEAAQGGARRKRGATEGAG